MRQAARRGLLTVMATGSVLASTAGYAYADRAEAMSLTKPVFVAGAAL